MTMESTKTGVRTERSLPEGWRWVRLGEVCEVVTGGTPPRDQTQYFGGNVPWIKPKDLDQAVYVDSSAEYLSEEGARISRLLPKGSVLVSCIGIIGKTAIAGMQLTTNQQINSLVPSADVDSLFLYFCCGSIRTALEREASTALVPILNKSSFSVIEIPLPPLAKQQRIAAILSEQMAAVEQVRRAAEARLEAAKALPAAYLRAVFNSPEAQQWPRKRLGEVCAITSRQVDPKLLQYGSLPHVNGENIETGTCRLTYLKTAAENGMISGKYLFELGDVLYSKLRPYLRKVVVADFRGVCSADMYPISVNREVVDSHFLAWLLVSEEFTNYANEESGRSRMPKLNREQLFAWQMPLPPLPDQQRIAARISEHLAAVNQARKALQEQLDMVSQLPPSLLRRAFAGGI